MNSSKEPSSRGEGTAVVPIEVGDESAREFLRELANLKTSDRRAVLRFIKKYRSWLVGLGEAVVKPVTEGTSTVRAGDSTLAVGAILSAAFAETIGLPPAAGPVTAFAQIVRHAWRQPTRRDRELGFMDLLLDLARLHATDQSLAVKFRFRPFIRVVLEAIHLADNMRVCGNSDCPAPQFIAVRRSQRYCSEECAKPAQRAHKLDWWKKHGDEWRNRRKRKAKRRR